MEATCCTFLFLLLIKSQGLCAPNVLSSWELMVCWTVHMTFLWMDCSPYFSPVNSLYTLINRISFSFFYALNYSIAFSHGKFFIFLCFSMGIKQIYHLHSPVNIQSNFKYSSCSLWGGSVMNLGTKKHRDKYFDKIDNLEYPGCFAMTELHHGELFYFCFYVVLFTLQCSTHSRYFLQQTISMPLEQLG